MNPEPLLTHKLRNNLQTLLLLGILGLLCTYLAWFIGGPDFAWTALFLVFFLYLLNPAASPRWVLALYNGRPLSPAEAPELYEILEALAQRAGLAQVPRLYYLPTQLLNAFTVGTPDNAAVALSDGLLRRMNRRELIGVLAHEVSHLANGDTQVMALADLVSRITSLLSLIGQLLLWLNLPIWLFSQISLPWMPILIMVLAPSLSALVQLALSRNREYEADRSAAALSGDPEGLISALQKLEYDQRRRWEGFFLPGQRIPEPSLLRTHPPTEERIQRLRSLQAASSPTLGLFSDALGQDFLPQAPPRAPRWHPWGLWW